jgi:hypothetical protein
VAGLLPSGRRPLFPLTAVEIPGEAWWRGVAEFCAALTRTRMEVGSPARRRGPCVGVGGSGSGLGCGPGWAHGSEVVAAGGIDGLGVTSQDFRRLRGRIRKGMCIASQN